MGIHRHLKHWFIPHKQNDHKPHLIRARGLVVMAALILGVQATTIVTRPASVRIPAHGSVLDYATDINPVDLFNETNQQRVANGIAPLKMNAKLNDSANMKANNMFALDYWAHVSPSGIQPWYWFGQAGYDFSYAGENLAMNFDTTSGVMTGWMNSPGHRANILNPHYVDVGFAVENGSLVGDQTTLVVAHYGAPAAVAPVIAAAKPAPSPTVAAPVATPVLAAAPVATPTATPSTQSSPAPSIAPTTKVTSSLVADSAPAPKSYNLFDPLSLSRTANTGTLITIVLLLILLFVYTLTHMTVWRKGMKRWRKGHYRLYAAVQLSGLTVAIVMLAASGFGKVG